MSYDLYFKSRTGTLPQSECASYFRSRRHYQTRHGEAMYEHAATGSYCVFQYDTAMFLDEEEDQDWPHPQGLEAFFNLNFVRPEFFGLEALPEVAAFVERFDLLVWDPQLEMDDLHEFDADAILNSWIGCNRSACASMFEGHGLPEGVFVLPSEKLRLIWEWNRNVEDLQASLGDDKFVPKVMLLSTGADVQAVAVWSDGIPMALPPVDAFVVHRSRIKGFIGRTLGNAICPAERVTEVLKPLSTTRGDGIVVVDYLTPPAEIQKFVRELPALSGKPTLIPFDRVLDSHLIPA